MKLHSYVLAGLAAAFVATSASSSFADCTWTAVSAGTYRSCGLRSDGAVECWGEHVYYGADTTPAGVFVAVTAGYDHACGIRGNGALECWGNIIYDGSPQPGGIFSQVSAGAGFTCALRPDGKVDCFGDEYGDIGDPAGEFAQIASGWSHACGVRVDGTLGCWGSNGAGQSNPPPGTYTHVAAGRAHSCAVNQSGTLACWGENGAGQASPPGGQFTRVATGNDHSCAVSTAGAVVCWGDDTHGQASAPSGTYLSISTLRDYTCALRSDAAVECWGIAWGDREAVPGTAFASASAGTDYNCGLRTDGIAECWGTGSPANAPRVSLVQMDAGGRMGCGITAAQQVVCWDRDYNSLAEGAPTAGTYSRVAIGGSEVCAIRTDGSLHCWDGSGSFVPSADLFSEAALGQTHGCGLRLDGSLACWGTGSGAAGIPSGVFTQIAAGEYHNCAIRPDATVTCWGDNTSEQTEAPAGTFLQVACGERFSCGLRPDHSVECWGAMDDPTEKFVQISAESRHLCGMLETGALDCFGGDWTFDDVYDPRSLACGECGNGMQDQADECDDGNLISNDGCSDICVPDCTAQPLDDCKFAQVSKIRIRDGSDGRTPQILWQWLKGSHTDEFDLQDPSWRPYHLCFYPDSVSIGAQILLPRRGWTDFGWSYADPQGSFGGVESFELQAGDQGRARIRLRSSGDGVPSGLLPATSYVVQLQSTASDVCWESIFPAGRARPASFTSRHRY